MQLHDRKLWSAALIASLPVLPAYTVIGLGFGILLRTRGYGALWAAAMSGLIYAGSMQFVVVDLMSGGASLLTAALTTLMVNARHLFYGISMVDRYQVAGREKPYLIFALTDETYSLVISGAPEGVSERGYYLLVSAFDQIYWIAGSLLGSLAGSILRINTEGIDFAMTALFITVFVDQWRGTKQHLSAVIGVLISTACLLLFGASGFLIPAMLIITALLTLLRGKLEVSK